MIHLAPSLLSADFSNLEKSLEPLKQSNIQYLHLDVMDGMYVPNISFGPGIIKQIRPKYDFIFDVHLMIENPDRYLDAFADAGADIITVHYEASTHIHRTLQSIRSLGKKAGVALNPGTPLGNLEYLLPDLDLILIMSVNPGFGNQSFIPQMLKKIKETSEMIKQSNQKILLEVDGGIKSSNVEKILDAGADLIVAGSDVFGSKNIHEKIKRYKEIFKTRDQSL